MHAAAQIPKRTSEPQVVIRLLADGVSPLTDLLNIPRCCFDCASPTPVPVVSQEVDSELHRCTTFTCRAAVWLRDIHVIQTKQRLEE